MNGAHNVLEWFTYSLSLHPVITNIIVTSLIYAAGDISQQTLRGGTANTDFKSAFRVAMVGGFVLAPIYVPWYRLLDYLFPGKVFKFILAKCFMDQCVLAPFTVSLFFIATSFLERRPELFATLKERGLRAYVTSCLFWPPVQAINFVLVPGAYRIVYVSAVAFVWTNIICYIRTKTMLLNKGSEEETSSTELTSDTL